MNENIQKLVNGVLNTEPKYESPSCGKDYVSCPFCGSYQNGGNSMSDIEHDNNCLYTLAQTVKTEMEAQPVVTAETKEPAEV